MPLNINIIPYLGRYYDCYVWKRRPRRYKHVRVHHVEERLEHGHLIKMRDLHSRRFINKYVADEIKHGRIASVWCLCYNDVVDLEPLEVVVKLRAQAFKVSRGVAMQTDVAIAYVNGNCIIGDWIECQLR
jgi:hypothetical protein